MLSELAAAASVNARTSEISGQNFMKMRVVLFVFRASTSPNTSMVTPCSASPRAHYYSGADKPLCSNVLSYLLVCSVSGRVALMVRVINFPKFADVSK